MMLIHCPYCGREFPKDKRLVEAEAQLDRLKKALLVYANENNWQENSIERLTIWEYFYSDGPNVAKAALAEIACKPTSGPHIWSGTNRCVNCAVEFDPPLVWGVCPAFKEAE